MLRGTCLRSLVGVLSPDVEVFGFCVFGFRPSACSRIFLWKECDVLRQRLQLVVAAKFLILVLG